MKSRIIIFLIFVAISPADILSQTSNSFQPQSKIALVIGNGNYLSGTLANPENDARAMKVALQNAGFTVLEYENLSQSQMKKAIDDFGTKLKNNEVGLFFYAGHGIQSKGYNYLIPVDAELRSEQQIEYDCVQADRVLALMEASGAKVNILILDACRNNPFERSWTRSSTGKGLAFMNAPGGTLIAYATSPGSTASDGSGNNGLYTSAILESMQIPDITIIQMFQYVRAIVSQKSNKQQIPWESTSLTGDFYFNRVENATSEFQKEAGVAKLNEISTREEMDYITDPRDNEKYKTVKIGNQIWMAENLRTSRFNDGTPVPLVTDGVVWAELTTPGYCWYDNDVRENIGIYGGLYNWYTVKSGKLCPKGWHVPTDNDWTMLTTFLGEDAAGNKLKETGTTHWNSPVTEANNVTGFSAIPGGSRNENGAFLKIGNFGYFWSSTGDSRTNAWYRLMIYNTSFVSRGSLNKKHGFSVRCLKDL